VPGSREIAQAIFDGLSAGASYALLALAFSILWATVRTVNLALIQVVAIGAMAAYAAAPMRAVPALGAAALMGLVAGLLTHYIAIATTLRKGLLVPIIASLGVGLVLQSSMSLTIGDEVRRMPRLLPDGSLQLFGAFLGWGQLIVLAITAGALIVCAAVARLTSIGLSFRATAWRPQLASAYGVDTRRVRLISAAAAAAASGLAGGCIAILSGSASPVTGADAGLSGLVAMLIGGAGNPLGAVVGGLTVGLLDSLGGTIFSTSLQSVLSLGLLFIIMISRPSGLMKER
jgi:branched-chain amino acid transport system permease protein